MADPSPVVFQYQQPDAAAATPLPLPAEPVFLEQSRRPQQSEPLLPAIPEPIFVTAPSRPVGQPITITEGPIEVRQPRGTPRSVPVPAPAADYEVEVRQPGRITEARDASWHGSWRPQLLEAENDGSVVNVTPAIDPLLDSMSRVASQVRVMDPKDRERYIAAFIEACGGTP
jgi:hypothetical protein